MTRNGQRLLMLIDDEPAQRRLVSALAARGGWRSVFASDGEMAIAMLGTQDGMQLDAIVLDPPTFSRDEKGKVFRVESNYGELAELALSCLAPGGWMLCCTNCRKLDDFEFDRQILAASPKRLKLRRSEMPADFTGDPYLKSVWVEA